MVYTILVVLFLLLMGAVISGTFAERSSRADRPPIYYDESFMHLVNLLCIPMIVIFIILLFLNWKITLLVGIVSWLLGGNLLRRVSEHVIIFPLHRLLVRRKVE